MVSAFSLTKTYSQTIDQNEKNIHSSHARLKSKMSGQLMGIADYMSTSLKVNVNLTMHMSMKNMKNIWTCAMKNLQTYRHNGYLHITYRDKHMNVTL